MASADFTIADVLAWARTKPAEERYDFTEPSTCALGQFAREVRGYSKLSAAREDYGLLVSPELRRAAQGDGNIPRNVKWTFGALVTRLEALCPDQVVTPSEWTKLDAYLTEQVTV